MAKPELSVIVPVYNTGKYLAPCLESLLAQDFTNFEIIVVDDGSKDGSGQVIDDFARRDARVIAVHQENAGVSAARNAGLDLAQGDWISFIDSDDTIETNTYSTLLRMARENQADAVMFEYQADFLDGTVRKHQFDDPIHYGMLDNKEAMYCIYHGACFVWAALYQRKLVENVRYRKDIYRGEDTMFLIEAFAKAERVFSTSEIFYHYVQSEGSAARGGITPRQLTGIDALKWMLDYADAHYPELHDAGVRGYVNIMVEFYYEMALCGYRDETVTRRILAETKKYINEALASSAVGKHQKRKFLLFKISPKLFYLILSKTRKG